MFYKKKRVEASVIIIDPLPPSNAERKRSYSED